MPGPAKTPAELKLIAGTERADRQEPEGPKFEPVREFPAAPQHLNSDGQQMWNDLKRAERGHAGFQFDAWQANDACAFIEKLPHVEGTWDSPTIVLHPSHVFFVVNLFGFRAGDGTRRFTSALLNIGRKNAKSTLF